MDNPYAPVSDGSLGDQVSRKVTRPAASGGIIAFRTLMGVSFSGSVFGLGFAVFIAFSNGTSPPTNILWLLCLGVAIGFVLAFVAALFVVPIALFFCAMLTRPDHSWRGTSIQRFGASCGFVSGYACLAVPSGLSLAWLVAGFLPGAVGAIGTWLFVTPLARRTDKALALQTSIDQEIESNQSNEDKDALAAHPFAVENE